MPSVNKENSGFTLVEMAMVLFIVTLLLAGLVPTISSQMEQQRANETRKKMSEIKEALIGFALRNGRLPCAARAQTPAGQSNAGIDAGVEVTPCDNAGNAVNSQGVVPWVTLGTSETDGWGNRFTYRVTSDFADAIGATTGGCIPIPVQATFGLCSIANLTVESKSGAGATIVADQLPVIIISHGKNGAGAWTSSGTQRPVGSSTDELENSNHTDLIYISHTQTSTFDDLVEWISPNILYNRMVAAGKLP